ncbi:MAG: hypothetical protein HYY25_10695 [Candidatus Wallbacteria bacterium]|nr:hypothetical protein [Candidatus Wallbacteria bacterium]
MTFFRSARGGFMFPVALTALIIFAIVGMTMMFSGTSEYQQTAVVTHGLVANQLVLGLVDEIQAIVYDRVNNVDPNAALWRKEVLQTAAGLGTLEKPLKDEPLDMKTAITQVKGELIDAKVVFMGFRPMKYATKDTYDVDKVYYHKNDLDTEPVTAPGSQMKPRDFTGYYRIQAAVRFGKAVRYYSVVHDLKVVDVSPPAREFATFAFNVFKADQEDYLKTCLVKGGPMNIYANDVGRIFIRGPYFLTIGDNTEGIGGSKPPGDQAKATILDAGNWWDWSLLPVYHEGLENGSWNRRDPGRPKKKSASFKLSLNFLGFEGSSDPGMSIANGDAWYIGTVPWGATNFSIFGDPNSGRWHGFRGLKGKEDEKGRPQGMPVAYTEGIGPLMGGAGAEGDVIYCEPKGEGLIGTYNVARFSSWEFKLFFVKMKGYKVEVDAGKPIYGPFGIRYEKKRQGSGGLLSTIIDVISIATLGFGAATGAFANMGAGAIAMEIGKVGLQAMGAQALASMLNPPTALPPVGISADELLKISEDGYWPPNFKPYPRCASRIYPSLKEAMPTDDKPLTLDGVMMVDKMELDKTLKYRGKGIVACFTSGANAAKATLPNGVMRDTTDQFGLDSYLTLAFMSQAEPTSEEGMLELGMPEAGHANEATFMVSGGIKPMGPKTAVEGSMVCLALNKDKIPDGSSLEILYDKPRLTNETLGGQYNRENYLTVCVTPKIAVISDKFVVSSGGTIGGGDTADGGFAPF